VARVTQYSATGWVPDARTILWYVGIAHEQRIQDTLRREVERRGVGLSVTSDEYWHLVAEVAVEHLSVDMMEQAAKWGTRFPTAPPVPTSQTTEQRAG
jgi:hypothetical protein